MAWIILVGAAAFGLVVGCCASLAVARFKTFRLKELGICSAALSNPRTVRLLIRY